MLQDVTKSVGLLAARIEVLERDRASHGRSTPLERQTKRKENDMQNLIHVLAQNLPLSGGVQATGPNNWTPQEGKPRKKWEKKEKNKKKNKKEKLPRAKKGKKKPNRQNG
jgi:hypothetical protein